MNSDLLFFTYEKGMFSLHDDSFQITQLYLGRTNKKPSSCQKRILNLLDFTIGRSYCIFKRLISNSFMDAFLYVNSISFATLSSFRLIIFNIAKVSSGVSAKSISS